MAVEGPEGPREGADVQCCPISLLHTQVREFGERGRRERDRNKRRRSGDALVPRVGRNELLMIAG